jgi:hypothetical protein
MGKVINAATLLALSIPAISSADELALTCSARSLTEPNEAAFIFSVLISPDKQTIISVDGDNDGGTDSRWLTDRFSKTIISGHFDMPGESGTITLDRFTGVVDVTTMLRLDQRFVLDSHGNCEPSERKF